MNEREPRLITDAIGIPKLTALLATTALAFGGPAELGGQEVEAKPRQDGGPYATERDHGITFKYYHSRDDILPRGPMRYYTIKYRRHNIEASFQQLCGADTLYTYMNKFEGSIKSGRYISSSNRKDENTKACDDSTLSARDHKRIPIIRLRHFGNPG